MPIAQIDIVLVDSSANAFSDDSLPSSITLADFDIVSEEPYGTTGGRMAFQSLQSGQIGEIRFMIDSISTSDGGNGTLPGDGWPTISGSVYYEGNPLCAMVLANGQFMFTCGAGIGLYDLDVPLDANGEITLFVFASGFAPFRTVLTPEEALDFDIDMVRAAADSREIETTVQTEPGTANPAYTRIWGMVSSAEVPVCAMILANGQSMFSCGDDLGSFDLEVPLDNNGEITLFVFASGFAPYREVFMP